MYTEARILTSTGTIINRPLGMQPNFITATREANKAVELLKKKTCFNVRLVSLVKAKEGK